MSGNDIPLITAKDFFKGNPHFFIHLSTDCLEYGGKLHMHEFVEVSYIISGEAEHEVGGECYSVCRGDVVVIGRFTPHTFRPKNGAEPFVAYDMMFTESFFEGGFCLSDDFSEMCATLFCKTENAISDIHLNGAVGIGETFHKVYTEFYGKRRGYLDLIRAYAAEMIINVFRRLETEDSSRLSERLRLAVHSTVSYLDSNFRRHVTLDELAGRIFFSKDYLNRIFRELMGMPIGSYLTKLRLDEAKKLLRETELTVSEIAVRSGFGDVKALYTVFKREVKMTPGEYRGE